MQVMDFFEENWKMDNFVKEVCLKDPWKTEIQGLDIYIHICSSVFELLMVYYQKFLFHVSYCWFYAPIFKNYVLTFVQQLTCPLTP